MLLTSKVQFKNYNQVFVTYGSINRFKYNKTGLNCINFLQEQETKVETHTVFL